MSSKVIGIDLGTTNSVVAFLDGSEIKVIPNQNGHHLTPSVVAFSEKSEWLVGDAARRQAVTNPKQTISSVKRFMGRRLSEVAEEAKTVSYNLVGGAEDPVTIQIGNRNFSPPEVSAMVLRKLKESAEAYLGETVTRAVITVPAYFNDAQRTATLQAAAIAGFETEWEFQDPGTKNKRRMPARIISEPTAAALAYGFDGTKDETLLVFDLGGGTFDVTILEVVEGHFNVNVTNGDTHLGGDNFDQILIDHFADDFKKEHSIDLRKDPIALQRLKEAAELAKKDLSYQNQVDVTLPYLSSKEGAPLHLQTSLTRATFERMVEPLIERCGQIVRHALKDAKLKPEQINQILLVGGMSRMPRVQRLVKELFNKEGHRGVNPDEVVAMGAAIQGSELFKGSMSRLLLVDVTPLSLGVEVAGGRMKHIVPRNSYIPVQKTEGFSTAADNQTVVKVSIFQGESEIARSPANRLLGEFTLSGIRPAKRGEPKIEVTFSLDTNGVLEVTAIDRLSGNKATVEVRGASGLGEEEIAQMRSEAEQRAGEDRQRLQLFDAREAANAYISNLEAQLRVLGGESNYSSIRNSIAGLQKAVEGEDHQAIIQKMSDLKVLAQGLNQGASPTR